MSEGVIHKSKPFGSEYVTHTISNDTADGG